MVVVLTNRIILALSVPVTKKSDFALAGDDGLDVSTSCVLGSLLFLEVNLVIDVLELVVEGARLHGFLVIRHYIS